MFDKVARQPLQLPICDVAWLPRLLSDDSNGNGKQLIPERHPLRANLHDMFQFYSTIAQF